MATEMSPASCPSTPRCGFELNPITPSTCASSSTFVSEDNGCDEKFPAILDSVSVNLLSYLPTTTKVDGEHRGGNGKVPTIYRDLQQPFAQKQDPEGPRTPRRSSIKDVEDVFQSPPPAPKPTGRNHVDKALKEDDLVEVVDILSRNPKLVNMPFLDGSDEFPLERALRLQCDPMIIQILEDFVAKSSDSNDAENGRMKHIPRRLTLW